MVQFDSDPGCNISGQGTNRKCRTSALEAAVAAHEAVGIRGPSAEVLAAKKSGGSSKFVGVCFVKKIGMWKAQIRKDGKLCYLGQYSEEEEAARKYDEEASKLGRPVNCYTNKQIAAADAQVDKVVVCPAKKHVRLRHEVGDRVRHVESRLVGTVDELRRSCWVVVKFDTNPGSYIRGSGMWRTCRIGALEALATAPEAAGVAVSRSPGKNPIGKKWLAANGEWVDKIAVTTEHTSADDDANADSRGSGGGGSGHCSSASTFYGALGPSTSSAKVTTS
jgi:hypothetical protein